VQGRYDITYYSHSPGYRPEDHDNGEFRVLQEELLAYEFPSAQAQPASVRSGSSALQTALRLFDIELIRAAELARKLSVPDSRGADFGNGCAKEGIAFTSAFVTGRKFRLAYRCMSAPVSLSVRYPSALRAKRPGILRTQRKTRMRVRRLRLKPMSFVFSVAICAVVLLAACGGGSMMMQNPPRPMVQNPDFVFVANANSNSVAAFQLDPTSGMLSLMGQFPVGGAPEFMAVDQLGRFLFVGNTGSNNISAFEINSTTGALTAVMGSPFAAGAQPEGMALSGSYLFVANNADNSISAFTVDSSTGGLTTVKGSPFTGVTAPFGAATDALGKFLFVTNLNANQVSSFSIDSDTGALSAVAGSPFATGSTPIGLAADPNGMFVYGRSHVQRGDAVQYRSRTRQPDSRGGSARGGSQLLVHVPHEPFARGRASRGAVRLCD
jgi:hypothetical protein